MFDRPTGGRVIANFTGGNVPMTVTDIPADPVNNRSKLVTSMGNGSVRIEGYTASSAIPVFTVRDLPVMAGNVWLTSAHKVNLVIATAVSVTVERTLVGSQNQNVRATTTCDALSLQRGKPTPIEVPGNGREYISKVPTVAIYDAPNGNAVFSLLVKEGSFQAFWSTETKLGFVHGRSRSDVAIDGWIRSSDLDAIKKGEMIDPYNPGAITVGGKPQLTFDSPPRVATATKEIPIRARRDEREWPIGAVEAGAEIYIMETVGGWTNILPKDLHVMPPDDGGFYIATSEVPK